MSSAMVRRMECVSQECQMSDGRPLDIESYFGPPTSSDKRRGREIKGHAMLGGGRGVIGACGRSLSVHVPRSATSVQSLWMTVRAMHAQILRTAHHISAATCHTVAGEGKSSNLRVREIFVSKSGTVPSVCVRLHCPNEVAMRVSNVTD